MGWVLIIGVCVYFIYAKIKLPEWKEEFKDVLICVPNATYLGGFEDKNGGQLVDFRVKNDKILLAFLDKDIREINMDNIENCRIVTENSLVNETNIRGVLMFGVFANGNETKNVTKNYLAVDTVNDNKKITILFECNKNEEIVKTVREKINEIKENRNL